jgi:DNA-binding HxlR family transcriptional regulator
MKDGTLRSPGHLAVTTHEGIELGGATGCQAREILDRVGDKWSLVLIYLLAGRTMRFMELRRAIPQISQRMLTVTLRHLERDGLVQRTAYPTVPVTVEYCLTGLGCTLLQTINALIQWVVEHEPEVEAARAAYDATYAADDESTVAAATPRR